MMKRVAILVFLAFAALMQMQQVRAQGNNNVIDEVVWVVGDEAIYKSEVEDARIQAQMRGNRLNGDPYCIIPEELAIKKLFLNQADIDSIYATASEVNAQIDYAIQVLVSDLGSEEKVEELYQMSMAEIRNRMYDSMEDDIVSEKMQKEITKKVKATPAEVRRYFKDASPEIIPFVPTQVEVQIITRAPIIPQEEIDEVKAQLREYTERIQSGETQFSTLALLYSEDEGTARQGGEFGFFGKAEVVPEFAAVAFSLTDPTKVSKVVETEYGFHIIQLIEKRGDRLKVRHILRKPKIPQSAVDDCLVMLDSLANDIRTGKSTFDDAAFRLSADKDTRNNKGLMMFQPEPGATPVSRFEMQQLPQEVARVVNRMHVGEISDPFTMIDKSGKTVCAVVKLKTRTEGHKATIADDYQILQDQVLAEKSEEILKKWIEEKQRTTYVRITEGWNNCEFRYPGWVISK